MSKITVRPIDPSEVPTPDAGNITYFTDVNDGLYKYKDENGTITIVGGGSTEIPLTTYTLDYTDWQPNPSVIGSIPTGDNIPPGNWRIEFFVEELVTPVIPGVLLGGSTYPSSSLSPQYQNGQFIVNNPSPTSLDFTLRLSGFGGTIIIDALTAGEWKLYYRLVPVTIA